MPNVQAIPIFIRLKDMFLQCIKWINMQNEPRYSTGLVSICIHWVYGRLFINKRETPIRTYLIDLSLQFLIFRNLLANYT